MMYEILRSIRNFFPDAEHQLTGHFSIENNTLNPCMSLGNQYVLIEGSKHNDGCHYYADRFTDLVDESFSGTVTPLAIPKEFLELVEEIKAWQLANASSVSAYTSESFGGYSYIKATVNGVPITWQDAFKTRLKPWRKM